MLEHLPVVALARGVARRAGLLYLECQPGSSTTLDVGIPFDDESVAAIYIDSVLECLDLPVAARLIQECRRVLAPGGRLRVSTFDLAAIIRQFESSDEWERSGRRQNGFDWSLLRCDAINRAFRDDGRRRLYDQTEVSRLGILVGLIPIGQLPPGTSDEPRLVGLESPVDASLIVELIKPQLDVEDEPCVSIVIPAYRPEFLREAVQSALAQTYENVEVIISDDGDEGVAPRILDALSGHPRFDRVSYHHNARRLGGAINYVAAFERARGPYVKFLNDDDLLAPRCVERMAACLRARPDLALVTSHRSIIDHAGNLLPDAAFNRRPVGVSSVVTGPSAIARILRTSTNYIGEPSTTMFRRADLASIRPNFWSVGGVNLHGNGDVSLWINLLARGHLAYLAESLSSFRVHPNQEQRSGDVVSMALIAWQRAAHTCAELGLYDPRTPAAWDAAALLPAPWWAERPRHALAASARSLAAGDRAGALDALRVAALDASDDPELGAEFAAARARAGDAAGALEAAVGVAGRAPWCQPAHMVIAAALWSLGDRANAQRFIDETQNVCPLLRADAGVVSGPDGGKLLEPNARFVISGTASNLECTIEVSTGARPGFTNLPVTIEASLGGVEAARATISSTGDRVTLVIPLPAKDASRVLALRWRGALGGLLPDSVTPQWMRLESIRLTHPSKAPAF